MSEHIVAMPDGFERNSGAGLLLPAPAAGARLTEAQARLRGMVLDAVTRTPGATTPRRSTTCSPSRLVGR
jgi:hypothetical protein